MSVEDPSPRPALTFVIGTGRCGSTLVSDVLCLHKGTGFINNYEDGLKLRTPAIANSLYQSRLGAHRRRKYMLHPSEAYGVIAREVSGSIVAPHRDLLGTDASPALSRRLEDFFYGRARRQRVGHFLHKFTGWPRARLLHTVFPQAKFIHIVRDGRGVANSMIQQEWWSGFKGPGKWDFGALDQRGQDLFSASGQRFEVLAALQWRLLMQEYAACERAIPPAQWLTLKYEDIIADPVSHVFSMADFMELDVDEDFCNLLAAVHFTRDRESAYLRDLSPSSLAWIECCISDVLSEFGYEAKGD